MSSTATPSGTKIQLSVYKSFSKPDHLLTAWCLDPSINPFIYFFYHGEGGKFVLFLDYSECCLFSHLDLIISSQGHFWWIQFFNGYKTIQIFNFFSSWFDILSSVWICSLNLYLKIMFVCDICSFDSFPIFSI